VITRSPSRPIDRLVADLASGDAIAREAAVARLTVMGARAVERLVVAADAGAGSARAAALRALEAIADSRALPTMLRAVDDRDVEVATAAILGARVFLRGKHGPAALDRLTATALDRRRPDAVRAAAVRAVGDLDAATIKPLLTELTDDPSEAVRAAAALRIGKKTAPDPAAMLADAAEHGLPDDPAALRHAIIEGGAAAALPQLLRIIERLRECESAVPAARRTDWTNARAAAHWALANRGSRIALSDLRESIEAAVPLPVEFLAALSRLGDASCLEPIAAAYAHATNDTWWRQQLTDLFQSIAKREHITSRHASMKKIVKRWPDIVVSR
jgi:HEAT repeat protein